MQPLSGLRGRLDSSPGVETPPLFPRVSTPGWYEKRRWRFKIGGSPGTDSRVVQKARGFMGIDASGVHALLLINTAPRSGTKLRRDSAGRCRANQNPSAVRRSPERCEGFQKPDAARQFRFFSIARKVNRLSRG